MWLIMMLINCMTGLQLYSLHRCMGCTDVWGHTVIWYVQMYGAYGHMGAHRCMGCRHMVVYGCMGCTDIWGVYGYMGAYRCTCLPTTPEGICKKFSFPLILSHIHHLSTEMEGKKATKCLNVHLQILTQTIQQNNWWMLKNWRKRKEYKQFSKVSPFISLHVLP